MQADFKCTCLKLKDAKREKDEIVSTQGQDKDQINGGTIINYALTGKELKKRDKSRPHAVSLTAWRLLPVNYGALKHTYCPRDPLATNERRTGEKRSKKVAER